MKRFKSIIIFALLILLSINCATAEFSSYTNVFVGTENATSSRVTTVQTLLVGSDYDERLRVAQDSNVQAFAVYQVEDLSGASWTDIDHLNVTCRFTDSLFNENGAFFDQEIRIIESVIYTSANTPTSFIVVGENETFGLSDQIQCLYKMVYNVNVNFTIDYPYSEEFITPSYKTNFIEFQIDKLQLLQAQNSFNVVQGFTNNIAGWTEDIVRGVFELWLVMFFMIKIAFLYIGFVLVLSAIAFPVFLLIRFREKIRNYLGLGKNEIK